jgi:hypothetical protein
MLEILAVFSTFANCSLKEIHHGDTEAEKNWIEPDVSEPPALNTAKY